jgi:peroxiredoxin
VRGCTPQSCGFRDHAGELDELGALVAGLSAQPLPAQIEFAEREHMPFPVIADPELRLRDALGLPTFDFGGLTLYKRVTLVLEAGRVSHVFYRSSRRIETRLTSSRGCEGGADDR